jgi:hypothetical protein
LDRLEQGISKDKNCDHIGRNYRQDGESVKVGFWVLLPFDFTHGSRRRGLKGNEKGYSERITTGILAGCIILAHPIPGGTHVTDILTLAGMLITGVLISARIFRWE